MKDTVSARDRILDISVNLARIGNWTADAYEQKKHLIDFFFKQTRDYLEEVSKFKFSSDVRFVVEKFMVDFEKLRKAKINKKNKEVWAEKALTWANILQHRAQLV